MVDFSFSTANLRFEVCFTGDVLMYALCLCTLHMLKCPWARYWIWPPLPPLRFIVSLSFFKEEKSAICLSKRHVNVCEWMTVTYSMNLLRLESPFTIQVPSSSPSPRRIERWEDEWDGQNNQISGSTSEPLSVTDSAHYLIFIYLSLLSRLTHCVIWFSALSVFFGFQGLALHD